MSETTNTIKWFQVLLDSLSFIRAHWFPILFYAVLTIVIWIAYWYGFLSFFNVSFSDPNAFSAMTPAIMAAFLVGMLLLFILYAGFFPFLDALNNNNAVQPWIAVLQALPRLIHFMVLLVLLEVFSWVGLMLFIIPGIYIYTRLIIPDFLVLLSEKKGPIEAVTASWQATAGNTFQIFILVFLGLAISILAMGTHAIDIMEKTATLLVTRDMSVIGDSLYGMLSFHAGSIYGSIIVWVLVLIWTVIRYQIYTKLRANI